MLDQETIEALAQHGDLSASALYHAEVARIAYLSRQEQGDLVARARLGDGEAAHLLVINCLHWGMLMAHRIAQERRPQHVDVLDLMAEANLHMLEKVGQALAARDPVAYLMAIATQTIRVYCTYRAPLIQRPSWYSRQALAELACVLPPVECLDTPCGNEGKALRHEYMMAPPLDLESEEQKDHRTQIRFALFYHALQRLSQRQRATTIRLYGLFGHPAETPKEIAHDWQLKPQSVRGHARKARRRLALMLEAPFPRRR